MLLKATGINSGTRRTRRGCAGRWASRRDAEGAEDDGGIEPRGGTGDNAGDRSQETGRGRGPADGHHAEAQSTQRTRRGYAARRGFNHGTHGLRGVGCGRQDTYLPQRAQRNAENKGKYKEEMGDLRI